MKIIHKEPFTDEERATFREIIYGNIVRNMRALIEACENLEIPIQKNESKRIASEFMQRMDDDALLNIERHWTPELANDIQFLWTKEEAIQQAFAKRNLFQITDSAAYYFNAMDRIKDPSSYLPSVDDVLRSRLKTTGIAEMEFHLKEIGKIVKVIDVGGQRNGMFQSGLMACYSCIYFRMIFCMVFQFVVMNAFTCFLVTKNHMSVVPPFPCL